MRYTTRLMILTALTALLALGAAFAQIGGGGITGGGGASVTTGTFTLDFSPSCSANSTQTYAFNVIGKIVAVTPTQSIFCTSSATTMTTASGAWPVAIRPTRQIQLWIVRVQDNGAGLPFGGCLIVATDGTVSMTRNDGATAACGVSTWTAASTKGYSSAYGNFLYTLD